jgi:mannose-1-phosphate guanylyltransferase/mannose-6-phosphate isomerase
MTAVETAKRAAEEGALVTFGIRPDRPHTGYGYIEIGSKDPSVDGVFAVASFVEKPTMELAQDYVSTRRFLWNSGMFLFRASTILEQLELHEPDVAAAVAKASRDCSRDGLFVRPEPEAFSLSPAISVDNAIMERTENASVVPVDIGWSDVGSWEAVWQISPKDAANNVLQGPVLSLASEECSVRSEHGAVVVALGLRNVGVVATRDAILVTDLSRSQDVKSAVDLLREQGEETASSALEVFRPWGSYQTTDKGERFQTKRLVVKPGASLSLQKHQHRSEHWAVVNGTAEVTIAGEVRLLRENESTSSSPPKWNFPL